jgi:hypothetical protein
VDPITRNFLWSFKKFNKKAYLGGGGWGRRGDTDIWGMVARFSAMLLYYRWKCRIVDLRQTQGCELHAFIYCVDGGGMYLYTLHIYTNKGMSVQEVGYGWGPAQVNRVSFSPPHFPLFLF